MCSAEHVRVQDRNGIRKIRGHGNAHCFEDFVARSEIVVDGAVGYLCLRGHLEQCDFPRLLTCDKAQCRVHQATTGAFTLLVPPGERFWCSNF
ncbi:hypothetical protein D9M71_831420 [compost metagenome]